MTLPLEAFDPAPSGKGRGLRHDVLASWGAGDCDEGSSGTLPVPRRRAVIAAFQERPRLEAALVALPSLGFGVARFGLIGTSAAFEALLACRFKSVAIHEPGATLVLDEEMAGGVGSRPVAKALTRLPGKAGSQGLLVSDGWPLPLPPEPGDSVLSGDLAQRLAARGRPAVLLGLRLLGTQSPAHVCRALLAINDGPVELHDLRVS